MYYPGSEHKGADQLRGYREADLRLCFRTCKKPVSHDAAQIKEGNKMLLILPKTKSIQCTYGRLESFFLLFIKEFEICKKNALEKQDVDEFALSIKYRLPCVTRGYNLVICIIELFGVLTMQCIQQQKVKFFI